VNRKDLKFGEKRDIPAKFEAFYAQRDSLQKRAGLF